MQTSLIYAIIAALLIYTIQRETSKELSINGYVANTYLYILLALILTVLFSSLFREYVGNITNMSLLIAFFVMISGIMVINLSGNIIYRHIAWLVFISGIAYTLTPLLSTMTEAAVSKIVLSLGLWIGILSYFAFTSDLSTFLSWGNALFYLLLGLIIFQLIDMCFGTVTEGKLKFYSMFAIALFSGFVLYDTQQIIASSELINKLCVSKDQSICANYPAQSLGLFLDMINMFTNASILNH